MFRTGTVRQSGMVVKLMVSDCHACTWDSFQRWLNTSVQKVCNRYGNGLKASEVESEKV